MVQALKKTMICALGLAVALMLSFSLAPIALADDVANAQNSSAGTEQQSSGNSASEGESDAATGESEDSSMLGSASQEDDSSLQATALTSGVYLLEPASNDQLYYSVSASTLSAFKQPRNNVLTVTFGEDGIATIQNASGLYLSASGSSLKFASGSSATNQQWKFVEQTDGSYCIQNVYTGTALDISAGKIQAGTKVGLYAVNGTAAQSWKLFDAGAVIKGLDTAAQNASNTHPLDTDTVYYIETANAANKVLDVKGASKSSGANVQLYAFNKTVAQQWKVVYDSDGYVTFINVGSGMALDVSAASITNKSNVQQYTPNGSAAQKWIVAYDEDEGTYSITSALWSDVSLDIAGGKSANGTNVQVYEANGTAAQQFNLVSEADVRASLDKQASENSSTLLDGTYLINTCLANKQVLDVKSGSLSNKANVQLYSSNMTGAQQWVVTHDEKGYVTFTNVKSGKALDVSGASVLSGTNVQQYTSNDTYAQKWIVSYDKDAGTYSVVSALWSGISLDISSGKSANGTNVQTYATNGTTAQQFKFINVNPDVEPCAQIEEWSDGYFRIASSLDKDYVLDVASGSTSDGANIQLYSSNGTYAQLYSFKFVATDGERGYYQIINAKSDKALDVAGGNLVNGTNVQQYAADTSNANQLWSVSANDDGTYTFINKASGLALDVAGSKAANSTNVQGYEPNATTAQNFVVEEVTDLLPEGIMTIKSALSSSKVVDVASGSMTSGANVQLYSSNGSQAQKWQFKKVGDNTYTIQSVRSGKNLAVDSSGNVIQSDADSSDTSQQWVPSILKGKTVLTNVSTNTVLDVTNGSTSNGTNIQTYAANGTAAQRFDVVSTDLISNGTYFIQAFSNTKMVVDVTSGSTSNGANIQLYANNDTGAQKWKSTKNSDGTYTFRNAASGKALDVTSASATNGANIQLYTSNGSNAQKWKAEYVDGGGILLISALDDSLVIDLGSGVASKSNVQLGTNASSATQKFTFQPTTYVPPASAEKQAMLNRISGQSSYSQWLIAIDRSTHKIGIFKGSAGNWKLQYYWSCVVGAPSTPTITGTYYTTGYKKPALSNDARAIYCTQIKGGYYIHSVLDTETEVGQSLSHGCVRLRYSNAYWVYTNIGAGTAVVIYN